jgi:hypothetical protein
VDLPRIEDRTWALEQLGALIRLCGARTFLEAPLLEPTDSFFPDRWTPDEGGVERLLRRLLRYAGMGSFEVRLELCAANVEPQIASLGRLYDLQPAGSVAAWFSALELGVAHFGVDVASLGDPEALVRILCHEVAHAYRARHRLGPASATEIDLTTVYLGFGLITANTGYRHRVSAAGYRHAGGRDPSVLSFALAAQASLRCLDGGRLRRIARLLEATPAACFKAASALFAADPAALDPLGLSPPPRREPAVPAPHPDAFNAGLPVYRVRRGWLFGLRCSDPDCRARLDARDRVCPGCGGRIAGDVASENEARRNEEAELDPRAASELASLLRGGPAGPGTES